MTLLQLIPLKEPCACVTENVKQFLVSDPGYNSYFQIFVEWPEAYAIAGATVPLEDILCCHSAPQRFSPDKGKFFC